MVNRATEPAYLDNGFLKTRLSIINADICSTKTLFAVQPLCQY